jgi:hypothetical protein
MTENTAIEKKDDAKLMEDVLLHGDLSKLTPAQRVNYYKRVCESTGLNPLTRPFDYLTLNNKLTLYAKKDATDQLRNLHGVSIDDVDIVENTTHFIVKVKGHNKDGRTDVEIGVVAKTDMQGNLANQQMKAVTKAKRRLTLSLCGLGWLDETEIETIPDAKSVIVDDTGVIIPEKKEKPEKAKKQPLEAPQKAPDEFIEPEGVSALDYAVAAAMTAQGSDKEQHRLDTLTIGQLLFLLEHTKSKELAAAAELVMAHNLAQPAKGENHGS